MLNECNGCEYKCSLSHIDICTLGSPCPHQRSTPMTKEEWLHTLNTEQLADVLMKIFLTRTFCHLCPEGDVCDIDYKCKYSGGEKIEDWLEWLKQPHTSKE